MEAVKPPRNIARVFRGLCRRRSARRPVGVGHRRRHLSPSPVADTIRALPAARQPHINVHGCAPTFGIIFSVFFPYRAQSGQPMSHKLLILLALPWGIEPHFSP
jgi:hypothetical protein